MNKQFIIKTVTVITLVATLFVALAVSSFAHSHTTMDDFVENYPMEPYDGYYSEDFDMLNVGTIFQLNAEGVPIGNSLTWSQYAVFDLLDHYHYHHERGDYGYSNKFNCYELIISRNDETKEIIEKGLVLDFSKLYSYAFNCGLKIVKKNDTIRICFSEAFFDTYGGNVNNPEGDYMLTFVAYYGTASPEFVQGGVSSDMYDELNEEYTLLMEEYSQLQIDYDRAIVEHSIEAEELNEKLKELDDIILELELKIADFEHENNGLKADRENSNAILNFFSGIYDTVSGVLNDLFGLEVMGVSVGNVVGFIVICLVLFFVVRLFI